MRISRFTVLIMLVLPFCLPFRGVQAQAVADTSNLIITRLESGNTGGTLKVVQDQRLTSILRKHYEFNRTSGAEGWRILIYKGREMSRANQWKADFEETFSQMNLRVNVEYNEPDFSTLVGSFRTKEDAYRYKQKLSARFPQAYLVQARITIE
jgi:hypothetical protein